MINSLIFFDVLLYFKASFEYFNTAYCINISIMLFQILASFCINSVFYFIKAISKFITTNSLKNLFINL